MVIPITVLEELDSLKSGRQSIAADCRQAIRELDTQLGRATPEEIETGVPISQGRCQAQSPGDLSILMTETPENLIVLPNQHNDNRILNDVVYLKHQTPRATGSTGKQRH